LFFGVGEVSFFAGALAAAGAGFEGFVTGFLVSFVVGFLVGLAIALATAGLDLGESFLAGMFYLCSLYFA
jgi:hypothetical protein